MKENEYWEDWFQDYLPQGVKANEPAGDIYYPIRNNLYSLHNEGDELSINKVVGIIGATFFWRDMIKHVLAQGHDGLVVVVENPCSATFTYQIKCV
jgi:hypothetical protein